MTYMTCWWFNIVWFQWNFDWIWIGFSWNVNGMLVDQGCSHQQKAGKFTLIVYRELTTWENDKSKKTDNMILGNLKRYRVFSLYSPIIWCMITVYFYMVYIYMWRIYMHLILDTYCVLLHTRLQIYIYIYIYIWCACVCILYICVCIYIYLVCVCVSVCAA